MSAVGTQTCYRHPDRETGVSCSSCGKPICPDCMTPTPVGMRCPDCAKQRTQVRTARNITDDPTLTYVLIAINVIVFLGEMFGGGTGLNSAGGELFQNGALYGPLVGQGSEWWRIVTAGFLHAGLLHLAFNMYFLWYLGTLMESSIGKLNFGAIYFVSLIGGSLGALLLSWDSPTIGASGAVFGLLGAAIVGARARGLGQLQSSLAMILGLNLVITFVFSGNISVGGHLGGLALGLITGWLLLDWAPRQRGDQGMVAARAITVFLGVACFAGCIWVANNPI